MKKALLLLAAASLLSTSVTARCVNCTNEDMDIPTDELREPVIKECKLTYNGEDSCNVNGSAVLIEKDE